MSRILHVEDDHSHRENMKYIMKGVAVVQPAVSVAEATREYKPGLFDLVICDGTLAQNHDGVHFAVMLARDHSQKVLVLSGDDYALEIARQHGLPCLHKLDGINSLKLTVQKLLE